MSDIKNEYDDLKDFPNYNKNHFDQIFPGIRERDEKIASLITTIESQQEKLDLLTEPLSEVVQTWVDACAMKDMEISKLESDQKGHLRSLFLKRQEIESLKAITELAVKGLKEISDGGSTGEDARDMRRTADYILSEIARLSQ